MFTAPNQPLRLLHLEDSELDHELTLANLRRGGAQVQALRVDTRPQFAAELGGDWDVIISDYNLPGFTGLQALDMLRESGHTTPFVLVSGEIGEDTAVQAMRSGASDYLLKSQMARLHPAVMNAISAAQERRRRQAADAEVAASRQRLRELAQHLQTSVEAERVAIAREIHDDVGGALTALKHDLAWMERRAADPELAQRARGALETLQHALESSQRIMHNLRPAILEQGLVAALQWMTQRFERRNGVSTTFRCRHDTVQLPAGVPLVAYRTAQEALTNISKHAQATRVVLDLSLAGQVLSLEISDNGRGLQHDDLAKARSFGIRGLHERAGTVGGWIDISSSPQGTTLLLSIPLGEAIRASQLSLEDAMNAHRDNDDHNPSAWGHAVIRVILCDDHALIRRGIRDTLSDAADIQVVGEAGDYGELRSLMRKEPCDVLVLDINLPGRSGLDVLHVLKDEGATMKVLIVSMYPEDQYAIRSLRAGAYGYANKAGDPLLLVQAVRTVSQGRKYVTPEIAEMLVESIVAPVPEHPHEKLSDRELQTAVMIASGKRLSDIAGELNLSPKTVSVYRARVLEKLQLANNAELTVYAIRNGLVGDLQTPQPG